MMERGMSRAIKFRAWQSGVMCYAPTLFKKDSNGEQYSPGETLNDELPLMQFTGLHDKNGKEIYEGDVVKSESGLFFEVKYQQNLCSFRLWGKDSCWDGSRNVNDWVEVIGNTHEDPELLENQND